MRTVDVFRLFAAVVLATGSTVTVAAQEPQATTRETVIEQTQAEKATELHPYVPDKAERVLNRIELVLSNEAPRWHPFFSDDLIRAAVHTGQFSNPAAEKYLGDVLIKRRDKITSLYLTAVNPIVDPRLEGSGRLTFENAAFAAGAAKGPATDLASWLLFDNATGTTTPLSDTQSSTTTIEAPSGLPTAPGSFVAVHIAAVSDAYPTWRTPVRTYFRRDGASWTLVGLERLPEGPSTNRAVHKPGR